VRGLRRFLGAVFVALLVALPASSQTTNIVELVRRADHVLRGRTTAAVMRMDVHTSSYDRHYSLVYWEDDRGGVSSSKVLVKILGPALWRGHGTLKVGNRLTVYDPGTDRMTVLSSSMLGDSWMGSHFNNDDFVKDTDLATDYSAREVGSHAGTSPSGQPVVFHDIELRPTPRAPVAWDRIESRLYVEGGNVIPVRLDYYQRAGDRAPYRSLAFSDVKNLGGRVVPSVLTMTVASKPGEYTRLTYEQVRFDVPVPSSKFTEQALRQ
jgi:outer membrane lipoprotein-sorting protein